MLAGTPIFFSYKWFKPVNEKKNVQRCQASLIKLHSCNYKPTFNDV